MSNGLAVGIGVLFFLAAILILKYSKIIDYIKWNSKYKSMYDEEHSLYLNYKEFKDLYFINPDRWFWSAITIYGDYTLETDATREHLFYDYENENDILDSDTKNDDEFKMGIFCSEARYYVCEHAIQQVSAIKEKIRKWNKDSVSRIYLTYPAYLYALKLKKNHAICEKRSKLQKNRRRFLESCQNDIDKLRIKSQAQIELAQDITEKIELKLKNDEE